MVSPRSNLRCLLGALVAASLLAGNAHPSVAAAPQARASAPAATLTGITLNSSSPDSAQLVIELSAPAARKVFSLDDPRRLVVDLTTTKRAAGVKLPAALGPVASIRSGARPGNGLRLVLELSRSLTTKSSFTNESGRYRLVVDLGTGPAAIPTRAPASSSEQVRLASSTPVTAPAPVAAQSVPVNLPAAAAHAPREVGRDVVIVIDAGHGGKDPGAIGRAGTREKDVTLAIARALKARIDAEPGMRAVLTRDGDRFLLLRDRMGRARAARADLFVSIHADSIADRSVSGSSVYVLSDRGASSEAARWLAERENAADLKGGVSLGDKNGQLASVLLDLSQSASLGASMEAAERVLGSLDRIGEIRKRQVQTAAFVVLKSPDVPSMLVETAFISNPAEEKRLRNPEQQQRLAASIFAGLREHFRSAPPDGSMFARLRVASAGSAAIIAGSAATP